MDFPYLIGSLGLGVPFAVVGGVLMLLGKVMLKPYENAQSVPAVITALLVLGGIVFLLGCAGIFNSLGFL